MDTDPVNIVPIATKRPSSRTASAARLSSTTADLTRPPFSGSHSWRYPACLPTLPNGLDIVNRRCWPDRPSYTPNRQRLNKYLALFGGVHVSLALSFPVSTFQMYPQPSFAIDTNFLLSGLKSKSSISFWCLLMSNTFVIFGKFQTRIWASVPPVAMYLQSKLIRTTRCSGQSLVKSVWARSHAFISKPSRRGPSSVLGFAADALRSGLISGVFLRLRTFPSSVFLRPGTELSVSMRPFSRSFSILKSTWYNWQWLSWPAAK